jgi:hypothetical protein
MSNISPSLLSYSRHSNSQHQVGFVFNFFGRVGRRLLERHNPVGRSDGQDLVLSLDQANLAGQVKQAAYQDDDQRNERESF